MTNFIKKAEKQLDDMVSQFITSSDQKFYKEEFIKDLISLYSQAYKEGKQEALKELAHIINNNSVGGVVKEKDILESLEELRKKIKEENEEKYQYIKT